jgi:hypothetical protein
MNFSLSNNQSFKEFKERFYNEFTDLTIFNFGEFNGLKIVLDGLKVNYYDKFKIRFDIFLLPTALIRLFYLVKRIFLSSKLIKEENKTYQEFISLHKEKKVVVLDDCVSEPFADNNKKVLKYFGHIQSIFSRNELILLQGQNHHIGFDLNVNKIKNLIGYNPFDNEDKELLALIKKLLYKIVLNSKFSLKDKVNIAKAFHNFFDQFRLYKGLFKDLEVKYIFFNMHYHKEGAMLLFKRKNMVTIELQHGIILNSDIFYIMPECFSKITNFSFFPDYIVTFGKYWSNKLKKGTEFKPTQIIEAGYSIINSQKELPNEYFQQRFSSEKIVLITTQTYLHQYFISYIQQTIMPYWHLYKHEYSIIVKIHPSENIETYNPLRTLESEKIFVVNDLSLYEIFPYAVANISIYSTALYDGLIFGVPSYSLIYEAFNDYLDELINDNISTPLDPTVFPSQIFNAESLKSKKFIIDKNYYFKKFDTNLIKDLIK